MNVYSTDKIRNVVLLGHGGSGKTSLVEAVAYLSGAISRLGSVADGNTLSDYDKEEQKRKFSINTTILPVEWEGTKINLLDTPGYFDFVGEVEEAASAADAAIIVVNGRSGVEVGVQKAWDICEKYNLPRMFFVTNMDQENTNFTQIVNDLTELYGKKISPMYIPIFEDGKYVGYVNVVKNRARKYVGKGDRVECDIPADLMDELAIYRETMAEDVAERSEEMMDRFFDEGVDAFTQEELIAGLKECVLEASIFPVCMGSNTSLQGMRILLDDILNYFPRPIRRECSGINTKTGDVFEANYEPGKEKSAFVFKSIVDQNIGKYSMIKVMSGILKPEDTLYNDEKQTEFRAGKLYVFQGAKPVEVKELHAGDLGALAKVEAATGDTLSTKACPVKFEKPQYSTPYTYKRYVAKNKGDDDKISSALSKLMQEDMTMKMVNDAENRQALIYGMGDQHLDVIVSKLLTKFKVEVELERPRVAFRETIRKKADVDSKYKKQSGGHGQYGHVKMTFEPSGDMEKPYVFEQIVVGGAVPKNFFPAVEKGIADSMNKGPLAGYPIVGIKAVLYDGSYHPVDSSEMAFKTAASQALKKGFMDANPVLLEPIASVKVVVPDKFTGDVMGDLNKRRGRVLGMNPCGKGNTCVEADVPMSEMYGYSTQLRSMTGGIGDFSYEFARYEQAPTEVQEKEVAARAAAEEE